MWRIGIVAMLMMGLNVASLLAHSAAWASEEPHQEPSASISVQSFQAAVQSSQAAHQAAKGAAAPVAQGVAQGVAREAAQHVAPHLALVFNMQPSKLQPLLQAAILILQESLSNGLEGYLVSQFLRFMRGRIWVAYYDPSSRASSRTLGRGGDQEPAAVPTRAGIGFGQRGESLLVAEFDPTPARSELHPKLNLGGQQVEVQVRQSLSGSMLASMATLAVKQFLMSDERSGVEHKIGKFTIHASASGQRSRQWPDAYAQHGSQLFLSSSAEHLRQVLGMDGDVLRPLRLVLHRLRQTVRDYPLRIFMLNHDDRFERYLKFLEKLWGISLALHKESLGMVGLALKLEKPDLLLGSLELFPVRGGSSWAVSDDAGMVLDLLRRRFLDDRYNLTSSATRNAGVSQVSFVLQLPNGESWETLLRSIFLAPR